MAAGGQRVEWVRVVRAALLIALVAFAFSVARRMPRPDTNQFFDTGVNCTVYLLAAVLCLSHTGRLRAPWTLLGVVLLLNGAADAYYSLVIEPATNPPHPWLSDWLTLACYPLIYIAIVLLLRFRLERFLTSMWLDGLVAGLGAAAVAAALTLGRLTAPAVASLSGGEMIIVAYPVGDLIMLVVLLWGCAAVGFRLGRTLTMAVCGLLFTFAGDLILLVQEATGSYVQGGPLDLTWLIGAVIIGLAAARPDDVPRENWVLGWSVVGVPAVFAVASLALLSWQQIADVPPLAGLLAVGCLVSAIARSALTFHEVRALAAARHQARTDELTGLVNRRGLSELLDATLPASADAADGPDQTALLLLDLDRFKEVNDALGHSVGDDLLASLAPRLAAVVDAAAPAGSELARLGGDEFAIVLPHTEVSTAQAVATKLSDALREPVNLPDASLHISASIGIALAPAHATDRSGLLRAADVAMYQAKNNEDGIAVYDPLRDANSKDRLQTIEQLRGAISTDQLLLHYQPQIRLTDLRIAGIEALVRWQHPHRGLLTPDRFLPLAEQSALMRRLTRTVLDTAVAQCAIWWHDGLTVPVSVNLSASNLLDADLIDTINTTLHRHRLPASALVVEITEDVLMTDSVRARVITHQLRQLGISVSVDDYGTGYSSLAYLRELAVDELKLDRVFTLDLPHDPHAAAITRHTVDLAHALGLRMVAEGVESTTAAQLLTGFGCDLGQGFHIAAPMPAGDLHAWLARRAGMGDLWARASS